MVPLLLLPLLSEDLTFVEFLLSDREGCERFTAGDLLSSLLETEGVLGVACLTLLGDVLSTFPSVADCLSLDGLTVVRLSVERFADLLLLTFCSLAGACICSLVERVSALRGLAVVSCLGADCLLTSRILSFLPGLTLSVRGRLVSPTCLDPVLAWLSRPVVVDISSFEGLADLVLTLAAGLVPCLLSRFIADSLPCGILLPVERR